MGPTEFRRGYNGYAGVTDTYLVQESPPKAHGGPTEQQFHIKESLTYGIKRTLIKFDLSAYIPATAQILDARLELYRAYYSASDAAAEVRLYHLLQPWSELNATWTAAGLGADWLVEGAGGAGADYEAAPFATSLISTGYNFKSIAVTAAVQRWVLNPVQNHGLLIMGTNSELRFWSSDAPTEALRPRLLVTYEVPAGVTPSPTATTGANPTATSTPWGQPTATATPWGLATATPTSTSMPVVTPTLPPLTTVRSDSWPEAFDPVSYTNCIQTGPSAEAEGRPASTSDILLVWRGAPTSASLSYRYGQLSYPPHTVLINGHVIGQVTVAAGGDACGARGSGKITFDPAYLVSGRNKVEILNDGRPENSRWGMTHQRIELTGQVEASTVISVTFTSSLDRTTQR
ncbi:MAG: DNRLRE domain-containing protein, partial [Chloroflexota bacterium]